MTTVKLGSKVRDTITGFTGTVTSRTEYLNRCIRYGVQGHVKDGEEQKLPDTYFFDEEQLVVEYDGIPEQVSQMPAMAASQTGGYQDPPCLETNPRTRETPHERE